MEIKGTRRKKNFLVRRTQDSSPVDTTPEEFQNGSLFLRLGLPSTLIRQENAGNFSKTLLKPDEFENAGFAFECGRKTLKSEIF